MAYEAYCASCTYMKESGGPKYWCERKGEDRFASDSKCHNWCEAYSRTNYTRGNMYDNSINSLASGGCYLTTIMCKILKYPDNNYYLNTLRKFRDEVMKTNPKYIPMLITYDTIGPIISYNLSIDSNRLEIASALFSNYIIKSVEAIEEGKYNIAISIYMAMTTELGRRYNANIAIIAPHIDNINMEELGHAKTKVYAK